MRGRTKAATVAAAACALALAAGCGSSGSSDAAKTAPGSTSPPTTSITNVVVGAEGVKVIPGSATGTSPCEKAAPTPASPGEVGAGTGGSEAVKTAQAAAAAEEHGGRGAVEQVALTTAEKNVLNSQIAAAKAVAKKFPTVAAALGGGYQRSTPFVPCIGAHYTNASLINQFDPNRPSELLYDGTTPKSKIVGLSYLVYHPGGAPDGFAGPNDRWHQHNANGGLCFKGATVVGGESMTREQCAAIGGRKHLLTDTWMVHAWVVPGYTCSWGTFSGECPRLGGRLCGNAAETPDPADTSQCDKVING